MEERRQADKIAAATIAKAAEDAAETTAKAVEVAKMVIEGATLEAAKTIKDNNIDITKILANALREVFNENIDSKRFIDVTKIPLICQSIVVIHSNIEKIESNITWIVRLIIGAVVVALLGLVLIK